MENINFEQKSTLAKLLAMENITILRQSISTAMFDIKNRVLYLPLWRDISADLNDMLIVHEVGHALETDLDKFEVIRENLKSKFGSGKREANVIQSCLNIVEDARIDRLQMRRYPGSRKNYATGYRELYDKNFFGTQGKNVAEFNFLDRLNLHFKVGNLLMVPFNGQVEKDIVATLERIKTIDEVGEVSERILDYLKEKNEGGGSSANDIEVMVAGEGDGELDPNAEEVEAEFEDGENSNLAASGKEASKKETDDPFKGEESNTDSALKEELSKITDTSTEFVYVGVPEVDYDSVVIPNKKVLPMYEKAIAEAGDRYNPIIENVNTFLKEETQTISFMVKEFEMRKRAKEFNRISMAKTGRLDMRKIHSYKYNEDMFLRMAVENKGKNHGFVMFVDWSGSMSTNIKWTLRHIYSLVLFCRQIQVPYEVYLFRDGPMSMSTPKGKVPYYYRFENMVLREVFNSRMNMRDTKTMMYGLMAHAYRSLEATSKVRNIDTLRNTPLYSAMMIGPEIINRFQKANQIEIANAIFLTDGDGNGLNRMSSGTELIKNPQAQIRRRVEIIQDPDTKLTYQVHTDSPRGYGKGYTLAFLQRLKDRTGANVIGFFLCDDPINNVVNAYPNPKNVETTPEEIKTFYKEKGYYVIDSSRCGYDQFFVINVKLLAKIDETTELDSSGSRAKLRNSFIKSGINKKKNRIILTRFIENIS